MYDLNEISEQYFNNTKTKHLRKFEELTPKGNKISGYINQQPNFHLGSMIILSVNDEPVKQYIQSMPKIHYHTDERDISTNTINSCYEKLDGSCLILYPLKNSYGDIIEIVPKTRGRPVADKHFIELYNKVDQKPIDNYYTENDGILIFELYGILNQHDIIHYDTGIDIALIGIYEYGEHITGYGEWITGFHNEEIYGFHLPDRIFTLTYHAQQEDKWRVDFTSEKYKNYLPDNPVYYPTNTDAVLGIKHYLEELNKEYNAMNGRIATEGVVINTIRENGSKKWLKCKPRDIEEKHKQVNGIPRSAITKECLKYFDEYGSEVKSIYGEDPKHHTEYLHRQLKEEYDEQMIFKSKKRIERIFMQIWDAKEIPVGTHEICNELFDKYGEEGISHCMRMFSQEYPQKKKDARLVYGILEKIFIRNNMDL